MNITERIDLISSLRLPRPVGDAVLQGWLGLAYGDDEATKIMNLSVELRETLYKNVVQLGPAGDAITEFITKFGYVMESENPESNAVWLMEQLAELSEFTEPNPECVHIKGFVFEGKVLDFHPQVGDPSILMHNVQLYLLNHVPTSLVNEAKAGSETWLRYQLGTRVLGWMLTNQYVVPQGILDWSSEAPTLGNVILNHLGMHKLGAISS